MPQTRLRTKAPYGRIINELLAEIGRTDVADVHVEALMRGKYGTLDAITRGRFKREVRASVRAVDELGLEEMDRIAASWGMARPDGDRAPRPVPAGGGDAR